MFCELKLRLPKERAAARELDVLDEDAVDIGDEVPGIFVVDELLGFCLRICSAFASAFSCVRMKLAKLYCKY